MAITISNEKIQQVMRGVIDNFLIPHFISLGMNATGKWIQSLEAVGLDGKGYIRGQHYTFQLVNGRAGGTRPPIAPLQRWVQAKLGIGGSEGLGIAFAVAKKIEKEGTDYYPEGTDLLEVLNRPEVTQYIYTQIGESLSGQIKTEINRMIWQTVA